MKKTYFGPKNGVAGGNEPFWQPWGPFGWLWRLLVFLVLLFLLLLLLGLFKNCDTNRRAEADLPQSITDPDTPDPVRYPINDTINFPHDIQDPGPNLPGPEDNYLPPYDDDDIVTDDETGQQTVGNRLNVMLNSDANDEVFRKWADEFKALYPGDEYVIRMYDPLTKTMSIEVPASERDRMIRELPQQITDIDFFVFPESIIGGFAVHPNDPAFREAKLTWYFEPIQAYDAWEITKGSPDVVVAIVDSYFDLNHEELNSERIVKPFSVWRRSSDVAPPRGGCDELSFNHGSLVASTAIGNMDNQRGSAGIAPLCKFMPISVGHKMTTMALLQGMLYAIYQGASVVNISAGDFYPKGFPILELSPEDQLALSEEWRQPEEAVWDYAIKMANERNVTIVWAAGNQDLFTALDPSKRGDASIKVSAVDTHLHKADFSNYGNYADKGVEESTISAPGVNIFGACPYNKYLPLEWGEGTSFAAPIVTGAVALMKSIDPSLSTPEIIQILKDTGKPIQGNDSIGKLLQIRDALMRVKDNFANFDDIMQDHQRFVGLWMSTTLIDITTNGQPTGKKCREYMEVTSTSAGKNIVWAADTRKDYSAPFTITWKSDHIVLDKPQPSVNPNDDTYRFSSATYTCKPDSNNLLYVVYDPGNGFKEYYHLRKVDHRAELEEP